MSLIDHAELLRRLDYNPETGVFTWKKTDRTMVKGAQAGRTTRDGYVTIGAGGKSFLGHRLAWFYHYGEWPQHYVDHINRVRSDNRISNLRLADCEMNMHNAVKTKNQTGYTGVYPQQGTKKPWVAFAKIRGVRHRVGSFFTTKEANDARLAFIEKMTPLMLTQPKPFSQKMLARVKGLLPIAAP